MFSFAYRCDKVTAKNRTHKINNEIFEKSRIFNIWNKLPDDEYRRGSHDDLDPRQPVEWGAVKQEVAILHEGDLPHKDDCCNGPKHLAVLQVIESPFASGIGPLRDQTMSTNSLLTGEYLSNESFLKKLKSNYKDYCYKLCKYL